MQAAQRSDEYVDHMKRALRNYKNKVAQPAADDEWADRNCDNYVEEQGVLYKAWTKGQGRRAETIWQTVAPAALQTQIVRAYHTSTRNAHYGALRTFAQIRERYTWGRLFSDTREFVLQCEICQRHGARPSKQQFQHHLRSNIPGDHWVTDVVHLPKSKAGHEWLLTMIDVCSRWAIARPLRKEEFKNEEIARIMHEELSKTGVHINPRLITHDGGAEFKKRFEDVCHVLQRVRHVSIGDRPEGHGIIERFNRDIMQLTSKMCPSKKADEAWSYVVASACEAHNASIHSNAAQGSIGVTPSEIMHGVRPRLAGALPDSHTQDSITNADPGSRLHVEAVAQAHNKAVEHVKASREAYEQRLRDDVRNMLKKVKSFKVGDIVRRGMAESEMKTLGKKKMKLTAANSEEMIVVSSRGFGRYELQKLGDGLAPIIETSADLIRKAPCPTIAKEITAKKQAQQTKLDNTEWTVEKIIGESGKAKEKKYHVKWKDFSEPSWEQAKNIDKNCTPLIEYKKNKATEVAAIWDTAASAFEEECSELEQAVQITAAAERQRAKATSIVADLLSVQAEKLIAQICETAGIKESEIMFVYAGVPCETYSIAGRSNRGRDLHKTMHGYNYRKPDPERNPCCERQSACPYAAKARLHDSLVQHVIAAFAASHRRDHKYAFGIENPKGDLEKRPFMQPAQWPEVLQTVCNKAFDCCAFGHPAKKPMMFMTNLQQYEPEGNTGNGKCNNGECGMCEVNPETGRPNHQIKIAREPRDGFKGKGATRMKNEMPAGWLKEILQHAKKSTGNRTVIDLCAGWQSLRPVCEELNLDYIAVDIKGDRNVHAAIIASTQ